MTKRFETWVTSIKATAGQMGDGLRLNIKNSCWVDVVLMQALSSMGKIGKRSKSWWEPELGLRYGLMPKNSFWKPKKQQMTNNSLRKWMKTKNPTTRRQLFQNNVRIRKNTRRSIRISWIKCNWDSNLALKLQAATKTSTSGSNSSMWGPPKPKHRRWA